MGWWSSCIMGGDTPYDVAGITGDVLGLEEAGFERMHMPDDWTKREQTKVKKAFDAYGFKPLLTEVMKRMGAEASEDKPIVYQVVTLLAMSCGAVIPRELKATLLKRGCDADDLAWAEDDEERKAEIAKLRAAIQSYEPGKPTTLGQVGLLETMIAKLESGLVNTNVKPPAKSKKRRS